MRWVNLHVAQRIEILDRHGQLLRKELRRIGHDRRAARKEQPRRRRAALLAPVKLHGLVDLDVQPRHELPRDLRDRRGVLILRLLVSAAEADETLLDLDLLGLRESELSSLRSDMKSCVIELAPRLMLRENILPFSKKSRLLVLAPISSSIVQSSRSP